MKQYHCSNMDGLKEIIILSEMSDRERKIYHLYV